MTNIRQLRQNKARTVSRREFMRLSSIATVGAVTAACAGDQVPAQPTESATAGDAGESGSSAATSSGQYNEAPMLAEMVEEGALPSVDERLPATPLTVEPWEEVGEYGGAWNMVVRDTPYSHVYELLQYEPMLRYSMGGQEILPNIAESWEQDDEARVFTFNMRQDVKWSDGEPLTADDVVFWFEDMINNEDLFPAFPSWMTAGGLRPTLEKIDDYTVSFTFENPAPLFIRQMGHPFREPYRPMHYLQQFHADYVDAAELEQRVQDSGFNTWAELFLAEESWDTSTELPVLFAWDLETQDEEGGRYVRNPYYWKVDTEGNQLPYIDTVVTRIARETAVAQLMAASGEAELQTFSVGQFPRDTMALKRSEEQGNYTVIDAPISEPNVFIMAVNLNHRDPVLREIFNDRRFRFALSHAVNREEIRELVYLGVPNEIRQCAPLPESPYYHEAAAKNYVEYDPDTANALLDEMGLTERNDDEIRLRPDGTPLSIAMEVMARRDDFVDALELITNAWQELGINASVRPEDDSLYNTRIDGAEIDGGVHFAGAGLFPVINPADYIPIEPDTLWAPLWGRWYATGGDGGEEPPEEVQRQLELYDEILITPDEATRIELWREIMDIHAENLYHMGICDRAPVPTVVSNRMHNVPETDWNIAWEAGNIGTTNPCQYYKTEA